MIKIISGTCKGSNLLVPIESVRPTTNRVKKIIFDVVYQNIFSAEVLDGFSGSGALGLEALSIGAKNCDFLEKDDKVFEVLYKNVYKLNFLDKALLFKCDFFNFKSGKLYDIILLDPPYGLYRDDLLLQHAFKLLKTNGIIIYETNNFLKTNAKIFKEKSIGNVKIYFLMC